MVAALPIVLRFIASVVAPTTLVTALLVYFGRLHAQGLTRYLHVEFTVFDFTLQDFLVRSADGLFVPLITVTGLAALSIWIGRLLAARLPAERRVEIARLLGPLAGVMGIALLLVASAAASKVAPPSWPPELGGLSLSTGVLAVGSSIGLMRATRDQVPRRTPSPAAVAEWTVVFLLFSAGLFWAINAYALGVGQSRAQQIERDLPSMPDVALYSTRDLGLQLPGVSRATCAVAVGADPGTSYRFRYEGLKLVLQSGGYYLFLPGGWTHADGSALVIPRSDSLRLEFGPPEAVPRPPC